MRSGAFSRLQSTASQLTAFDRLVVLLLMLLGLLTAGIAWRGDQVGVRVIDVSPPDGAAGISSQTPIKIEFDQEMLLTGEMRSMNVEPAVSGTASWDGTTLVFLPQDPLKPDTLYTVTVPAGLTSKSGQTVRHSYQWQFQTGHPRVVYMAPDQQGQYQLFVVDPERPDSAATQLTEEQHGVWDYAPTADGKTIAYAALRDDGGNDLWAVEVATGQRRQLLACPNASCSGPAWAPDGNRLIYERRETINAESSLGPSRLWWLDVSSGVTVPVFTDTQWLGFGAAISPDGQWLSHVAPHKQAIYVYNLKDGRSLEVPSQMGEPAVWSPHSDLLLMTDMVSRGDGFVPHVFRVNVESGQAVDISDPQTLGDLSPAWSSDGRQMVFDRSAEGNQIGGQLWQMPVSGGEGHVLPDQPNVHHGALSWSQDGRSLLMQRTFLQQVASAEVWVLDAETGKLRRIAAAGAWPRWLP